MDTDDRELDALLEQAAPTAPPDLADRVVAAVRARHRRRRVVRAMVAAAAIVALCVGLWALLGRRTADHRGPSRVPEIADMRDGKPVEAETASYAAELPGAGLATHAVMTGRIDGTYLIVARPRHPSPRQCQGLTPGASAMTGALTPEPEHNRAAPRP